MGTHLQSLKSNLQIETCPKYSLILISKPLEESSFSCTLMSQRLLKTLGLCALEKKDLDTKDPSSTESSRNLCAKEEILLITTGLEVNPSMAPNSKTKTLSTDTLNQTCFLWPTPDPTPTAPNFSSPPSHAHGSTENTSSLAKSLKAITS